MFKYKGFLIIETDKEFAPTYNGYTCIGGDVDTLKRKIDNFNYFKDATQFYYCKTTDEKTNYIEAGGSVYQALHIAIDVNNDWKKGVRFNHNLVVFRSFCYRTPSTFQLLSHNLQVVRAMAQLNDIQLNSLSDSVMPFRSVNLDEKIRNIAEVYNCHYVKCNKELHYHGGGEKNGSFYFNGKNVGDSIHSGEIYNYELVYFPCATDNYPDFVDATKISLPDDEAFDVITNTDTLYVDISPTANTDKLYVDLSSTANTDKLYVDLSSTANTDKLFGLCNHPTANTKKTNIGGKQMDFSQIITFKMMNKLLDGDGELDLSKLFILQSLQKNGTVKIDDIMKAKLIAKFGLDKDEKELSVEKLMLLGMLQNGENFDVSQLMMAKMLDKDEKDFSVEKLMLLGMFQNGENFDVSKLVMMKMLDKDF